LFSAGDAQAGRKFGSEVNAWSPSASTRAAEGAFGGTRNSSDSIQYLGCYIYSSGGASVRGGCFARDKDYDYASCTTTDWDLLEVIKHMDDSSYVRFYANPDGTCETIWSYTQSYDEPKLP
jgi:hypothetical protein